MIRPTLPHNSCTCQARMATCLVAALGAALSLAFDPPLPLHSSTCQAHRATCLVAAHGAALLPAFDPSLGFGLPLAAPAWRDPGAEVERVRYAEPRAPPRVFVRGDRASEVRHEKGLARKPTRASRGLSWFRDVLGRPEGRQARQFSS